MAELDISIHATYRFAQRCFGWDVEEKTKTMDPETFLKTRAYALKLVNDLGYVDASGTYPLEGYGLKAVVVRHLIVTFKPND